MISKSGPLCPNKGFSVRVTSSSGHESPHKFLATQESGCDHGMMIRQPLSACGSSFGSPAGPLVKYWETILYSLGGVLNV
ncbi:hypothetical protein PBOR_34065 [Paenibacillus borealis]|uniref:Uncharacterized protein n=1 Tax=Paenibacillus borealis TaxID=160799 RepID=A0A089LQB0_PAEBO|nr:hypothetical protein PBOR_34065 [Paenibacillus borealis]